jgi:hypothetical protein
MFKIRPLRWRNAQQFFLSLYSGMEINLELKTCHAIIENNI